LRNWSSTSAIGALEGAAGTGCSPPPLHRAAEATAGRFEPRW
jgi:hypothetical protein